MAYVCPTCGLLVGSAGYCTEDGTALVAGDGDPLLGQTVGSFRVARLIGQGGMGAVYLGVQPRIGSRVAIKVLSPGASATAGAVERFFAEARAVNTIRHESIVNVIDLNVLPDGRPYIVMEYLEGAPLSQHFASLRPFPLGLLARLALETLGALGAAHAHGITHRDLKPDNLFVTSLGRVKVLDFGIAKLRPELGGRSDATRTGALLGTPQYMSPEQARGQIADARSDLYSLGVVLFEGATGCRPFEASSLFELLRQHIEAPPPRPSALRPDLPPPFEQVILRSMEKDKERRYQSAAEMAQALSAVLPLLPDAGISVPPPPTPPVSTFPGAAVAPTAPATPHPGGLAGGAGAPVAPTSPALTSMAGVARGLSAPPAPRSSKLGLVVGSAGLLIGLVSLTAAVVFFVSVRRGAAGASAEPGSAGTLEGGDFLELPDARRQARQHLPDAELGSLSVSGISPDGTFTLKEPTHAIAYVFRSPSASKTSKRCLVSVSKSLYGTFAAPVEDTQYACQQPVVAAPRCSIKGVLARGPSGTRTVTFSNINGAWQWTLMSPSGSITVVPDNC